MGLLSGTKVYLAGPIEYAADNKGGIIWRNELTEVLKGMGVRVYDPMNKPNWYPDIAKGNPGVYVDCVLNGGTDDEIKDAFDGVKFIEKADFRYVNDCEWLIVYLPKQRTYGTIDELRAAVNAGKPIMIFAEERIVSSWIMGMVADHTDYNDVFFPSMTKLIERIQEIDRGEVELDPLKWIFLSYFNQNIRLKPKLEWSCHA
jgi:nucleoside 2-deoxyribosyltransferase